MECLLAIIIFKCARINVETIVKYDTAEQTQKKKIVL